jgi:hypothetical protein
VVWRLGSFDLSMGVLLVMARPAPLDDLWRRI